MAIQLAADVLLKKKTTTMNITLPHIPPRRRRRHDGTGASRTKAPSPPEEVVFAFGLSGLPSRTKLRCGRLDFVALLVVVDEGVVVAERLLSALALLPARHLASA